MLALAVDTIWREVEILLHCTTSVTENGHRDAVGSLVDSPAYQYGRNCKDHDHELNAVEEECLGSGDEPSDDQEVDQLGAVGEPAERDENLPTEQNVDGTWNEMPRYLQPVWKCRPYLSTLPILSEDSRFRGFFPITRSQQKISRYHNLAQDFWI